MIKPEPPKPIPLPVLLVYGKPARGDFPQAAWFRAEDRASVLTGAENLSFAVLDIKTATEPSLLEGVHEGVHKGSGRMVLGSVSVEVYRRIEEHVRKTTPAGTVQASGGEKANGEGVKEQNMNLGAGAAVASAAAPSPALANSAAVAHAGKSDPARAVALAPATSAAEAPLAPWRNLRIGSPVLAKFWETNGEPNGWWVALITDVRRRRRSAQFGVSSLPFSPQSVRENEMNDDETLKQSGRRGFHAGKLKRGRARAIRPASRQFCPSASEQSNTRSSASHSPPFVGITSSMSRYCDPNLTPTATTCFLPAAMSSNTSSSRTVRPRARRRFRPLALADKPSGCAIWIKVSRSLPMKSFYWFGGTRALRCRPTRPKTSRCGRR